MKHRAHRFRIRITDETIQLDDSWEFGKPCPQYGYVAAWRELKPDKDLFKQSGKFEWIKNGCYFVGENKVTPSNYIEYLDRLDEWSNHPPIIEEDYA